MRERFEGEVRRRGLGDFVRSLGFVGDPADLYNAMDVFCLPTGAEGTPTALIEALASGLPVVVSDLPQLRRILQPDVTALFARPEPHAIEAAIRRLIEDPGLRERLRCAARTLAVERFSLATMIEETEAAYRDVLVEP